MFNGLCVCVLDYSTSWLAVSPVRETETLS